MHRGWSREERSRRAKLSRGRKGRLMGATTGSVQDSQWGPEIIPFPERELDG
jgi:hypothetical protein